MTFGLPARRGVFGAFVLALLLASAPCAAANPRRAARRAARLERSASSRYAAGEYDEAAKLLLDAFEFVPDPRYLWLRAGALERGGRKADACRAYRAFLAQPDVRDATAGPAKEKRQEAQSKLTTTCAPTTGRATVDCGGVAGMCTLSGPSAARAAPCPCEFTELPPGEYTVLVAAEGYEAAKLDIAVGAGGVSERVARLSRSTGTLVVVCEDDVGAVSVDGRMLGSTPRAEVALRPGHYAVEVHFPGRGVWRSQVDVRSGETAALTAVPPAAPPPSGPSGWTGWTAAGLAIAALAAGGGARWYGGTRLENQAQAAYDTYRTTDADADLDEANRLRSQGARVRNIGTVVLAAGGVAAGTAAGLFLWRAYARSADPEYESWLVPTVTPDIVAVRVCPPRFEATVTPDIVAVRVSASFF